MILLDLGMIVLAWNVAYWLRFHAINWPPAQMIVIQAAELPSIEALGLTAEETEAVAELAGRPFSNRYGLDLALSRRIAEPTLSRVLPRIEEFSRVVPTVPPYQPYRRVNNFLLILSLLVFWIVGVYRGFPFQRVTSEAMALFRGWLLVVLVTMATSFVYRDFEYSRMHMIYFALCAAALLAVERIALHRVLAWLRGRGLLVRTFVLVGDSGLAARFYQQWKTHPREGLRLVGLVTLGDSVETPALREAKHLGSVAQLADILEQHPAHLVISALTMQQHGHVDALQRGLATHFVDHKIVPDIYIDLALRAEPEQFAGIPMVTVAQSPLEGWNLVFKRTVDLAGSAVALLLFSPVLLTLALLIKLTSPGPVLYRQERMGWNGKTFQMLKFRSMRIDAEQQTGAVWATKSDDRSTIIGRVLRRTSLDELPQLFNVLRGEMSLVGPRPERPVFIERFRTQIPNYMLRHKVKAGMTGWAQINGWRGDTSLEKRIEFDLYYISHWSIEFDIRILFLTLFKGFVHPNAY